MRIRKRLAAIAAAGGGAHHQLLQQPSLGSPLFMCSTRQPISAAALTSGTAAHQLGPSSAHQLHVNNMQEERSSKSSLHVRTQEQVSQMRDRHAQETLLVSHANSLSASTSNQPSTDVCAVAGLEHPSQHGASRTVSSSGAQRADGAHREGSFLAAACSNIVDAVDVAEGCDMASCAKYPNKALRQLYTDNAPWRCGRSRLNGGEEKTQTSYGASHAYGLDASLCLKYESRDGKFTGAQTNKKAATITEPQSVSNIRGQWPMSFPTSAGTYADRDVHILTIARTSTQLPTNPAPTSSSMLTDHVRRPERMLNDEESGGLCCRAQGGDQSGNLQRLARDLIRNNMNASITASTCNDGKVLKWGILCETSHNLKQNNARINGSKVGSDIVHITEKKNKQDRNGGENERCCRRSGRGWQCKNMRAASGNSIYCNYHQLKVRKNHASWNARNKTMKENKRNRQSIEPEASIQPLLQNKLVDVKMFEFPLLPSKQHMYENVQVHDAISSEAGATFMKRLFQAAAGTEKQPFFNSVYGPGYDSKQSQNSTTFSSFAETVVPPIKSCTQYTEESNSEPQGSGHLTFKRRRVDKRAKVAECIIARDERKSGSSLSSSKVNHGVDHYVSVHKIDDMNDCCGAYKEQVDQRILRCKRRDGKGWRCGKMCAQNSFYCCHHQMKLSKYHRKRSLKARSRHIHSEPDLQASAKVQTTSAEVHSIIDHNDNYVEAPPIVGDDAVGLRVDDYGAHNEKNENEHREKKCGHADSERGESKWPQGLQDESAEDRKSDKTAHKVVHFKQLQQEQLRWWEYKQGGKDGTLRSEEGDTVKQAKVPSLPRRSERRLIIDVCKSTAAEHEQTKDRVDAFGNEQPRLMPGNKATSGDELLHQGISCTSFDIAPAKPHTHNIEPINTENAHQMPNNEPRQCKRNDGRGWQCKRMCADGKFYCEYHLMKLRNYVERTEAKIKGKTLQQRVATEAAQLQKQSPKSEENTLSNTKLDLKQAVTTEKVEHKPQVIKGSCKAWNHEQPGRSTAKNAAKHGSIDGATGQMEHVQLGLMAERQQVESKNPQSCFKEVQKQEQPIRAELPPEAQEPAKCERISDERNHELKQAEATVEGQQLRRCGRHDGRGWQCKSMCKEGSLYCEYHRDKLRRNHETWNAKKLQEKKAAKSAAIGAAGEQSKEEAGAVEQVDEEEMVLATAVRAYMKQSPAKSKKLRSWRDIEARL